MGSTDSDSLQPKLDEAHRKLEKALDEACADDVRKADTGELIRIEETLASASKAAKEAVSIRLRRRLERSRAIVETVEEPIPDTAVPAAKDAASDNPHRVFEDIRGVRWHAFAVHPTSERSALPEPFRAGWLAFESENEMRRLAPIPTEWKDTSVHELRELCHKAEVAPKRVNTINVSDLTPKRPK